MFGDVSVSRTTAGNISAVNESKLIKHLVELTRIHLLELTDRLVKGRYVNVLLETGGANLPQKVSNPRDCNSQELVTKLEHRLTLRAAFFHWLTLRGF